MRMKTDRQRLHELRICETSYRYMYLRLAYWLRKQQSMAWVDECFRRDAERQKRGPGRSKNA